MRDAVGICKPGRVISGSNYSGKITKMNGYSNISIANKFISWRVHSIIKPYNRITIDKITYNNILADTGLSNISSATVSLGYSENIKLNNGLDFGEKINITSVVNPFAASATKGIAIGSGITANSVSDGQIAIGMNPQGINAVVTLGSKIAGTEYYTYFLKDSSSWAVKSDKRDKTDITPISNALKFINKLTPVSFRMNPRSSYIDDGVFDEESYKQGAKKNNAKTGGLLAQDVEVALENVYGDRNYTSIVDHVIDEGNPLNDRYSMSYEALIPYLIGAINELTYTVKAQTEEIQELKNKLK